MTRATLVYLHGFNSSPQTVKGRKLAAAARRWPTRRAFYLPELHHRPAVAMRDVCAWVDANMSDLASLTFVGSSLGGYYATWLAEKYGTRATLINPVVRPALTLASTWDRNATCTQARRWELTRAHFAELDALAVARLTRMDRYFLLMRSGDELLDWREAVVHYAGAWQFIAGGGDPRLGRHR